MLARAKVVLLWLWEGGQVTYFCSLKVTENTSYHLFLWEEGLTGPSNHTSPRIQFPTLEILEHLQKGTCPQYCSPVAVSSQQQCSFRSCTLIGFLPDGNIPKRVEFGSIKFCWNFLMKCHEFAREQSCIEWYHPVPSLLPPNELEILNNFTQRSKA